MAQFIIKVNGAKTNLEEETRIIGKLEEMEQSILCVADNLGFEGASKTSIRKNLVVLSESVEQHKRGMGSMRDSLYGAVDLYEKTEKGICDYANGISNGAAPVGDGESTSGTGNQNQPKEEASVEGENGNSNGTVNVRTESGAEKYNLPDYALQGLEPDANGIYGPYVHHRDGSLGRVCEWNDKARTELSCTYYTLRKLNERGLSYPCVSGPGNGANWFGNFDVESGLPRYEGNNALEALASDSSRGLPQENIVVSFSSNPSNDYEIRQCGHVLLIDKIYRNESGAVMVQWSDNWPKIGSLNGSNPVQEMSLEQFMGKYSRSNGEIKGAVTIGAGNI